ncbi:hypothetical protein DFH07DRAFT_969597 [Mycena maculata]|uniref:Uncharacterized protein n=1 Tax=Mycena maculata TaxID=230809 RepID=A0AAD7HVH7_9AGAR|nr:hypothetical protein DFH07DRAFT_969597 [Mycena maculata]
MFNVSSQLTEHFHRAGILPRGPIRAAGSAALTALMANFDGLQFEQVFACDPSAQPWDYKSWGDFFVRTFQPGIRTLQAPENPNIINAACESQLYNLAENVQARDTF